MTKPRLRKVAFLDTNVLHYISLYLRQAKDNGLFPFGGDVLSARKHLDDTIEYKSKSLKDSLKKGLNVIEHLRSKDCRVEYSPVSEIELMTGRARGKAIEKAAGEGIPERMWTRFSETDIGDRLLPTDLAGIRKTIEGLGRLLDDAGIDATVVRADRSRDVLELAKDVTGLVYMSVLDSVIYAGALVAEADHVITADGYFKSTANRLKNEKPFSVARKRLESCTATVLSRESGTVTLPDAMGIPG